MEDIICECDSIGLGSDIYKLITEFATHSLCNQDLYELLKKDINPHYCISSKYIEIYWNNKKIELSDLTGMQIYDDRIQMRYVWMSYWNTRINVLVRQDQYFVYNSIIFDGVIILKFIRNIMGIRTLIEVKIL